MIKKPFSAYIYFSQEFKERLKKTYPYVSMTLVIKAINLRWGNLNV
jgi:hypothetical protein